jgi:hypothetical protein
MVVEKNEKKEFVPKFGKKLPNYWLLANEIKVQLL